MHGTFLQEGLERLHSAPSDHQDDNVSTGSSRASTPEMERKNSVIRCDVSNQRSPSTVQIEFLQQHRQNQQRRDPHNAEFLASERSEPPQTQTEFLQMHRQQQLLAQQQQQQLIQQEQLASQRDQYQQNSSDKPPIPPRGAPPPIPLRSPSSENMVQFRRNGKPTTRFSRFSTRESIEETFYEILNDRTNTTDSDHHLQQARPQSYQQRSTTLNHNGSSQYPTNELWHRQSTVDMNAQHPGTYHTFSPSNNYSNVSSI